MVIGGFSIALTCHAGMRYPGFTVKDLILTPQLEKEV